MVGMMQMMCATRENIAEYIEKEFGDRAEFMFRDSPDTGVFRHGGNKKWYAVLMKVGYAKLGLGKEGAADIINLKCDPVLAFQLVDGIRIFPAYHMNKVHWISVLLDGSEEYAEACSLVSLSHRLTSTASVRQKKKADTPERVR